MKVKYYYSLQLVSVIALHMFRGEKRKSGRKRGGRRPYQGYL